MRIGQGYDVHRLVESRALIIGGVDIPHVKGLLGHSDADVLLHAVTDAILGAAALGDIGALFPDSDPATEGIASSEILEEAIRLALAKGLGVVNIDCTVVAQEPKLRPYIGEMRENLAALLHVSVDAVSVKATTEEGLGFTGRREGIAAHAVVLLNEKTQTKKEDNI